MSKDTPIKSQQPHPGKEKGTLGSQEPWTYPTRASLIRDPSISCTAKVVYGILASYLTENCDKPFPSIATISKHSGKYKDTVQRALRELETNALLIRHEATERGRFRSTRYELLPHKPKGKKAHRGWVLPPRSKPATSITHMETAIRLVRKTPKPASPEPKSRPPIHPPGCICLECREFRAADDAKNFQP